jgi:hypothetical protein
MGFCDLWPNLGFFENVAAVSSEYTELIEEVPNV